MGQKIDTNVINNLGKIMVKHEITELKLENGNSSIEISRKKDQIITQAIPQAINQALELPATQSTVSNSVQATDSNPTKDTIINNENHPGAIKSPMVGTVYLCPQPGTPAFVKEGEVVKEGQTLLIIEAMKVMNPIMATKAGKVESILVEDNAPVEFNEILIIIE